MLWLPLGNLVWRALFFCPSLYSASAVLRGRCLLLPPGSLPFCDELIASTFLGKGQTGGLKEPSVVTNLTVSLKSCCNARESRYWNIAPSNLRGEYVCV